MPTVEFQGTEIDCEEGTILRDVLLEAGESPHNGRTDTINCFGHGSCGTCAVDLEGETSEPTTRERVRLSVPPHDPDDGLRPACRTRVLGNLEVRKGEGFWGQDVGLLSGSGAERGAPFLGRERSERQGGEERPSLFTFTARRPVFTP